MRAGTRRTTRSTKAERAGLEGPGLAQADEGEEGVEADGDEDGEADGGGAVGGGCGGEGHDGGAEGDDGGGHEVDGPAEGEASGFASSVGPVGVVLRCVSEDVAVGVLGLVGHGGR
jgi:hypothetical protein